MEQEGTVPIWKGMAVDKVPMRLLSNLTEEWDPLLAGTISSTHKKIAYKYKLQDNTDRSKRSRSDGTGKISKDSTAFP